MNLIQLERTLVSLGFKVTKYLTPEEGIGFAATLPNHPVEQDVVVMKNGDGYKVFLSTPVKKNGINPITPAQSVGKNQVVSTIVEQLF
jgi:hypothetical protein